MEGKRAAATSSHRASAVANTPTRASSARELIRHLQSCPQCGSRYHLNHVTDFIRNLVDETVKCPECGHAGPRSLHRLQ